MNLPQSVYSKHIEQIVSELETDVDQGLTKKQVETRLKEFGPNLIEKKQSKSWLLILLEQFLDPVIYVLIVAAILAFLFGEIIEGQ